jgi:TolB-like protein
MKYLFKMGLVLLFVALSTTGCSSNRAYKTSDAIVYDTINDSIVDIADQLLEHSAIKPNEKVAVATFVDLHKLNKTTHYGRNLAESFFNELYIRGINVVDIRGSRTLRVDARGEFFITRDIKLLKGKKIESKYVLVGTYTKFGNGIMINARIIDNITGNVVASARSIYDNNNCEFFENCPEMEPDEKVAKIIQQRRTIGITNAGCATVSCPDNCFDGNCYKQPLMIRHTKTIKKTKSRCSK